MCERKGADKRAERDVQVPLDVRGDKGLADDEKESRLVDMREGEYL